MSICNESKIGEMIITIYYIMINQARKINLTRKNKNKGGETRPKRTRGPSTMNSKKYSTQEK